MTDKPIRWDLSGVSAEDMRELADAVLTVISNLDQGDLR